MLRCVTFNVLGHAHVLHSVPILHWQVFFARGAALLCGGCSLWFTATSLRLPGGDWLGGRGRKHATLLNICNGSACKTNDSSRFRLALSHLPNPQKCKHADILSHVIVELGSEISFATLKKIKIPFSLKSKIGVFQPQLFILNQGSVLLVRWTEDTYCMCSEVISPPLIKNSPKCKKNNKRNNALM